FPAHKEETPASFEAGVSYRCLTMRRDQVVPTLYGRQAILLLYRFEALQRIGYVMSWYCVFRQIFGLSTSTV
ncbi:hypothetical protein, partial [Pseudomonas fluvialis]|uniref:hypothetical protein n=1 Tax=Pseudomonas fluvialis TaxID=1793966 RepID=UPI001E57A59F